MRRREPYRVILWGPGYTGLQALREMLRRPEFEVVGCFGYSASKIGADVGELLGQNHVGVRVTDQREAMLATDADVVVYTGRSMPDESARHEEIGALLRSGKNVVTSTAYFFPWQRGADYVAPLEAACLDGGATLHGSGIHPGWFLERFAMTATSLCTEVDSMVLHEIADLSHHAGEAIRGIGYGSRPETLGSTKRKAILSRYYVEMIAYAAHLLGRQPDEITADIRYLTTDKHLEVAAVSVAPGTVAAVDAVWTATVAGRPFITMRAFWYLDPEMVTFTDVTSPDIYDLHVRGRPVDVSTRVDLTVTEDSDVYGADDAQSGANLTTAVQLVHTIPAVVAAPPGILVPTVFAHSSRDLRDVVDPLARPPVPIAFQSA